MSDDRLAALLRDEMEAVVSRDGFPYGGGQALTDFTEKVASRLVARGVTLSSPDLDVERLRELSEAATAGPWEWIEPHTVAHVIDTQVTDRAIVPVAAVEGLFSVRNRNGAFIVAAVNFVRAALAESEP